jgi:sarcosine oxidase
MVTAAEDEKARSLLELVMPGAGGERVESRVCLYTNTPDRHFIIDWASRGRVLIVSPCSGHGFKFATAIGELAASLALEDRAWIDIAPFSLSRFA